MFRSINGPSSGPQELRSMQILVTFMEVLQLDGIPSVLQFEIKLYITIKSYCIKLLSRQQNSISGCILKLVSKPVMLVLITYLFMLYMQSCRQGNKKGTVLWYSVLYILVHANCCLY